MAQAKIIIVSAKESSDDPTELEFTESCLVVMDGSLRIGGGGYIEAFCENALLIISFIPKEKGRSTINGMPFKKIFHSH